MFNQTITSNKTVGKLASNKQQKREPLTNEEIDRLFEEAHKKLDAMIISRLDKSHDKLNGMWTNSEIIRWW